MEIKCSECKHKTDEHCVQYLGEACGWQWWTRTDESWNRCHKNYLLKKEEEELLEKINKTSNKIWEDEK